MQEAGNRIVLRAIVKENQDPDGLGRVKVVYPSFQGTSSEQTTNWAQVARPYASKEHGDWFVPEVGDRVLVLLESSNLNFPVIVGVLYDEKNPPPKIGKGGDGNADGKNALRFIASKSGHYLCLDDSSGAEEVELQHCAGGKLHIKKKSLVVQEPGGAQLSLANGKIALGAKGVELVEVLEQLLGVFEQNAATLASTAVGPGILNPMILAKVSELKAKLGQVKGSLE